MWLASHFLTGGLIFDSVKNERRWLKWPLFIIACYIFHWVLDSTPVYHNLNWPWNWWQWGIALYNAIVVILWLWQFDRPKPWKKWLCKIFAKRVLIGGFSWLCLDIFWLYRPWGLWLHGLFPNMGRWIEPTSSVLELFFMALVCLLGWRQIVERRRQIAKK